MAIVCASALVSFRMMRTWCAPPASTNVIPDVHMRCAVGIIPFIVRGDSLRNDDQAMAWMRVPVRGSCRLSDVLLHIEVGRSRRLLHGHPGFARAGHKLIQHIDITERSPVQGCAGVT
jgi:hypothetical protein